MKENFQATTKDHLLFRIFVRKNCTENVECHASQILLQLI